MNDEERAAAGLPPARPRIDDVWPRQANGTLAAVALAEALSGPLCPADDAERQAAILGIDGRREMYDDCVALAELTPYRCPTCGDDEVRSTRRQELDPRVGGFYCDAHHPPVMRESDAGTTSSEVVHIGEPMRSWRTLCDLPAGMVVAVNFGERGRARGPFCEVCAARADAVPPLPD